MIKFNDYPALLLVDIQKGFEDIEYWGGGRNNLDAEINCAKILDIWRNKKLPIIHVKHNSTNPESRLAEGQFGNEFLNIVKPINNEIIICKNVNSAFIGTNLQEFLNSKNIENVVIVGLTTDHCISTTSRMAGNLGFNTFVVNDAVATFDKIGHDGKKYSAQLLHDTAIASLNNEFAIIVNTIDLINIK